MKKITKELLKEFEKTICQNCNAYFVCGCEPVGCKDFENFMKNKDGLKQNL